jgi:dCMP deaminase
MNKIPYQEYFLTLAFFVAQRSIDPSTKCGAVLVAADKRILSTGYNGPLKGVDDNIIPLTRPEKYAHMLHAEENCLLAYNGSAQDLNGAVMYVTGSPCHKCLRMILQKGIRKIIVTTGNPTVMHDSSEEKICKMIRDYTPNLEYVELSNVLNILELLHITERYIIDKNQWLFKPIDSFDK